MPGGGCSAGVLSTPHGETWVRAPLYRYANEHHGGMAGYTELISCWDATLLQAQCSHSCNEGLICLELSF